jgi:hypothetical protein
VRLSLQEPNYNPLLFLMSSRSQSTWRSSSSTGALDRALSSCTRASSAFSRAFSVFRGSVSSSYQNTSFEFRLLTSCSMDLTCSRRKSFNLVRKEDSRESAMALNPLLSCPSFPPLLLLLVTKLRPADPEKLPVR